MIRVEIGAKVSGVGLIFTSTFATRRWKFWTWPLTRSQYDLIQCYTYDFNSSSTWFDTILVRYTLFYLDSNSIWYVLQNLHMLSTHCIHEFRSCWARVESNEVVQECVEDALKRTKNWGEKLSRLDLIKLDLTQFNRNAISVNLDPNSSSTLPEHILENDAINHDGFEHFKTVVLTTRPYTSC